MKDLCFISGLGADERLFRGIRLEGVHIHHVKWIPPLPQESWASYAGRLKEQIPPTRPLIIGMSLGGMMAIEISKLMDTDRILVISSCKTCREIPPYFRMLSWTGLHRWLPYGLLKKFGLWAGPWLFGPRGAHEKELLHDIILDTDETFFRWAWDRVVTWTNTRVPEGTLHIHGSKDRLLPLKYIHTGVEVVEEGTHFMVVHHAGLISDWIQAAIYDASREKEPISSSQ